MVMVNGDETMAMIVMMMMKMMMIMMMTVLLQAILMAVSDSRPGFSPNLDLEEGKNHKASN